MLKIRSTSNNTGISISGSYEDMNELDKAITNVIGEDGEYSFQAGARQRVLGICREIRLAYLGKHETYSDDRDVPRYAFRVLWPEAAFATAVLDNFVLLAMAKKLYVKRLPLGLEVGFPTVSSDHIALIHFFQDLVWNELERVVGEWQLRAIFGEYNELRKMHFKFPQLDGYCTQWLDILNTQYLYSEPDHRRLYLVYVLKKLFSIGEEYLSLKDSISVFEQQEGIRVTGISLTDNWLKNCEW